MRAVLFLVIVAGVSALKDDYLEESHKNCLKAHNTYSCFKYRTLKYISGITDGASWPKESNYSSRSTDENVSVREGDSSTFLKLVYLDKVDPDDLNAVQDDDSGLFEDSRQLATDSEWEKLIKFAKRRAKYFLMSHGVSLDLPQGARAVSDEGEILKDAEVGRGVSEAGRGKRKRLAILLPFLSLISLLKVKLLLVPILLSVLFIKKLLIVAALFLPTILSTLKVCKVPHQGHHQHQWADANTEYASGYGAAYSSYGGISPTYNKDWAASRAYNGYKTVYDKPAPPKPIIVQPNPNVVQYNPADPSQFN